MEYHAIRFSNNNRNTQMIMYLLGKGIFNGSHVILLLASHRKIHTRMSPMENGFEYHIPAALLRCNNRVIK